ncbi:hypothetical protein C0389_00290 [bacterium]|nr:hypothetical protein [bacterium]
MKTEALKFLSRFEIELAERKKKNHVSIALRDYCDNYQVHSKSHHTPGTHKGYRFTLSLIKTFLGDVSLVEVSALRMSEYFAWRIKTSSIYQARKDLIVLNSLFNKAVAEGYILQNPCRNIKRIKIPQKQPLFFSEKEFQNLIASISDKDILDIVIFAVQTGLRQMELITLRWNQINLNERYVILDNIQHLTKSKRVRTIPLSHLAFEILSRRIADQLRNLHPEYVFNYHFHPHTQSTLTHKFKEFLRGSGINPKLTFHSLRHTFASWLVQRGVSIYEVSKLLGHSSIAVTEIYSHLRAEDLRNAIEKLNN